MTFRFDGWIFKLWESYKLIQLFECTKWFYSAYLTRYTSVTFTLKSYLTKILRCSNIVTLDLYYVYQDTTSLARTRIFFQNNLHVFELLIILFISVFEMLYWKCKNIYNACVQDKWKTKNLVWFTSLTSIICLISISG